MDVLGNKQIRIYATGNGHNVRSTISIEPKYYNNVLYIIKYVLYELQEVFEDIEVIGEEE